MEKRDSDSSLRSIVYVSTALHLLNDAQLEELLTKTHLNNSRNQITGILLYQDGNFMQLIEGSTRDTYELYERIKSDNRHHNIITLLDQPIEERLFSDWSMAFRNLRNLSIEDLAVAAPYLEDSLRSEKYVSHPNRSLSLLKSFLKTVRY